LRILQDAPVDFGGLQRVSLLDPIDAAATLAKLTEVLLPPLLKAGTWLAPLLIIGWVVVSSIGRTIVLKCADPSLHARPWTLMGLQTIRMAALLGSFAVWFAGVRWAAEVTMVSALSAGREPNLVGYFALSIVATLGLFTLWAVVSWAVSIAPLVAMLRDSGAAKSLVVAFRLGPLKSKLVEINLVMGIVKIALIVLAMVFSATPLPFESVTTPEFLAWWWVGVTVLYLIASDFFHVARLIAYLQLWRTYERNEDFLRG
jgi:hypothetical protein